MALLSRVRLLADVAAEAIGGSPVRRTSRRGRRWWIEVRGLGGPDADAISTEVLAALHALPGVESAQINRAVARVVVTVSERGPAADLPTVIAEAERRGANETPPRNRPLTLPCDDAVLVARTVGAAAGVVGFATALAGRVLRIPGVPDVVSVLPTAIDQTPAVRNQLQRRLGNQGTDLLFAVSNSLAAALTVEPTAAAAEAVGRTMSAVEAWSARLAWKRHEDHLAGHCSDPDTPPAHGTAIYPPGRGEEYADTIGGLGLAAAAVVAAASRSPTASSATSLVAAPKPARAAREAFGCAMSRGLVTHHDAVLIRPRVLRALDRVDVIVIDPRLLSSPLGPAGHTAELRDPLATAVVTEARRTGARVASLKHDGIGSLAKGFDALYPTPGSLNATLSGLVAELHEDAATVALLTTSEMTVAHDADVTIGVSRDGMPPWGADVFVPDLAAVWRILRSMSAARTATSRGVTLAMASSALGALMLIPEVAGRGPEAVNLGALGATWAGYRIGTGVFGEELPAPESQHDWHAMSVDEVRRILPRPATRHRSARPRIPGHSWVTDFTTAARSNLTDPTTPILATGALASAILGSPLDAALVGSVVLTNALLSAQQQLHADRVLRKLLAVQEPLARRRIGALDHQESEDVHARELSPGDIIEVHAGEVVPADARVIDAAHRTTATVEVDESSLTGESLPVFKQSAATPAAPLAERSCMVYAGTTVVAGAVSAVVTEVGPTTEIRRAMELAPPRAAPIGLQRQLTRITNRMLPWTLAGGGVVGLLSMLRGTPLREAAESAVALTVAAVPEGLPLTTTLAQLAAARRLSKHHVLVRNAAAVEALARVAVVCFDKTGTLSENRLAVQRLQPVPGRNDEQLLAAALSTVPNPNGHNAHATDDAIRRAAAHVDSNSSRDAYLPFQSGRPFAAALTGTRLTIKGAPELLESALRDGAEPIGSDIGGLAVDGLRVLAVAERRLTDRQAAAAAADPVVMEKLCTRRLTPLGVIGLADTPRSSSAALITELEGRGIGVRLLTGDHPVTARTVATQLGMTVSDDDIVIGTEWDAMSADERTLAVTSRRVFARMSPAHKIDVVQTLESHGLVTAMVGDGANDAAAIRAASVGVGVAAPGSDPARTAADMMLLDGRIDALIDAFDESAHMWRRVQSAVSMLLGGNAGEVAFALVTSLLTGRAVLNARQMLLVNMLTDALPAAALAISSRDGAEAPRLSVDEAEAAMWRAIAIRGTATTAGATVSWLWARMTGTGRRAATVSLIGLVSTQLAQTLVDSPHPVVMATAAGSLAALAGVVSTPGLSQLFGCTPIGPIGWGQAIMAATAATGASVLAPSGVERLGSLLFGERHPTTVKEDVPQ